MQNLIFNKSYRFQILQKCYQENLEFLILYYFFWIKKANVDFQFIQWKLS
jgi:hypothetical protein